MLIAICSSLVFALLIWEVSFVAFLCNDYFFDSGRRSPTTLDFYIFISIFLSPLFGASLGFKLASGIKEVGNGMAGFLSAPYLYALIALFVLFVLILVLSYMIQAKA